MIKIYLLIIFSLVVVTVYAQIPQALTYQAVARNASGSAIINSNISIRVSIKDVNATGPTLYSETHSVTTNQFGLFTVAIGTGLIQSGVFANINWDIGSKFMKVEMDATGGSSYVDMGTSQMLSVPYALFAGSVVGGSGGDDWGAQTAVTNSTLVGNGLNSNPLGLAQQGAASGQTLKWNGSQWAPANDLVGTGGDNWGAQSVVSNSTLTGAGTFASPIGLAQQGATIGQTLKWNGSAWAPSNDLDNDAQTISLIGSSLTISNGNTVTFPSPINYSAGVGINIAGNIISNTGDLSNTNELQTLSVSSNQLTLSNGNTVTINAGTNYTAGTGIDVTGSIITNTSPDQIVSITGTGSAIVGGVYPNFTINASDAQTLSITGSQLTISNGNSINLPVQTPYTAGTGIGIAGSVISNLNPDQIVSLSGTGASSVSGAYPNFVINSIDNDIQTLSVLGNSLSILNGNTVSLPIQTPYTAGTGIGIVGAVISNLNPDQTVVLTGTGATSITGTYPNFTINSVDNDVQTLSITGNDLSILNGNTITLPTGATYTAGTGIGIVGTQISNLNPDQTVVLTGTGSTSISGTYPNFTINSIDTDNDAQTLSLAGNTLSISNGNFVTLPTGTTYTAGTGIGIAGNVISNSAPDQTVVLNGAGATTITLSAYPNFTISSTDAQTLSLAGNILSISNGNNVTLPTGTTYSAGTGISLAGTVFSLSAITDATLSGNGAATPLKIAQQGATNGQTLKWNGATWLPANDNDNQTLSIAGTTLSLTNGGSVALPAGTVYSAGSGINLTGTTFNNNAQTDATLSGNGTVATPLKIAQQGATNGQVLQWNGTTWVAGSVPPPSTMGQSTTSVFGTSPLTINPGATTFVLIPNLSQTINIPSGYSILITTGGGVATSSGFGNAYSVADIAIFVDGIISANGGYQRLIIENTTFAYSFKNWAIHMAPPGLTSGLHTISIRAADANQAGASSFNVSGDNTSVLQGELTITLIKN